MHKFLTLIFWIAVYAAQSQNLSITASGDIGPNSGTNWYIDGDTLIVTGLAQVRVSVIENHLQTRNLIVCGPVGNRSVTIAQQVNIASTSGFGITYGLPDNDASVYINNLSLSGPIEANGGFVGTYQNAVINTTLGGANGGVILKATGNIRLASGASIVTNGGNVIFWSNANGTNSNGSIHLDNNSTVTTNGGHVWMGGGSGSVSWNGLTVGDGFAYSGQNLNLVQLGGSVEQQAGIAFIRATITTNGGDFSAYGQARTTNHIGIFSLGTLTINVGAGRLVLDGRNTFSNGRNSFWLGYGGLNLFDGTTTLISTRNVPNENAIFFNSVGNALNPLDARQTAWIEGPLNVYNYGVSGVHFQFRNQASTAGTYMARFYRELNVLSASGPIFFDTGARGNPIHFRFDAQATFGYKIGTPITSSTGDINVISSAQSIIDSVTYNTTGGVRIERIPGAYVDGQLLIVASNPIKRADMFSSGLSSLEIDGVLILTIDAPIEIAGPITINGRVVDLKKTLRSTTGDDILIKVEQGLTLSSGGIINSQGGAINLLRVNDPLNFSKGVAGVRILSGASLESMGGDITIGGDRDGAQGTGLYAGVEDAPGISVEGGTIDAAGGNIKLYGKCYVSYGCGIRYRGITKTTGAGTIEFYGEAFGGRNGDNMVFGGITFYNSNPTIIETEDGNLTLSGLLTDVQNTGTSGINFFRQAGGQVGHINILSKKGDITIIGDRGTTAARGFTHFSRGNVYIGSPASGWVAEGNVRISYSHIAPAGSNGFKVKTTGAVTYEPIGSSFTATETFPATSNYVLAESASSLTIGKPGNSSALTIASAQTVAGPISIYAGTLTLNANLTSTNNGDISIFSDNSIAPGSSRSISAAGSFSYIPQSNSFASAVTYPINNLNLSCNGLLIGKPTNSANITFGNTTNINGPITAYGGTIAINANITTTNGGDISLFSDNAIGGLASLRNVTAAGSFSYVPRGDEFVTPVTFPITNLNLTSNGLLIGKPTNSADITFGNTTNINGPITAYGGTITLDADITTTNDGDISLFSDNAIGGLSVPRSVTAAGSFNFVPRGNEFGAPVTFPITNLSLTSNGLLIGKPTNSADVTFGNTTTINGPITAYGGTITLDADITTTNDGDISLFSDNPLGGLTSQRNITAAGSLKYIPRNSAFSAAVTYPIPNLNASVNGLIIGKSGNDKDINIDAPVLMSKPVALHGGKLGLNADMTCSDLILEGTSAELEIGKTIVTSGSILNDIAGSNGLVLKADATDYSQMKIGGTYSGNGNITKQQHLAGGWHNLSVPFSGATAGILGTIGRDRAPLANNLKHWDAAIGDWIPIADGAIALEAGRGYNGFVGLNGLALNSGVVDVIGQTPITSVSPTLDINTQTPVWNGFAGAVVDGWNLVANPFLASLDFTALTKTDVEDAFYVWDPVTNGYVSWSPASPAIGQYIAPMQSFWVRATGSSPSLGTFSYAQTTTSNTPTYRKSEFITDHLILKATAHNNANQIDELILALTEEQVSNGFDNGWDARKVKNQGGAPSLFSLGDGEATGINALPYGPNSSHTLILPLGFEIESQQAPVYTIALDDQYLNNEYEIYLEDSRTKRFHDLKKGTYTFQYDPAAPHRFKLHLGNSAIDVSAPTPPVTAWIFGNQIHMQSIDYSGSFSFALMDMAGRKVYQSAKEQIAIGAAYTTTLDIDLPKGTYLLQWTTEGGTHQTRFVR